MILLKQVHVKRYEKIPLFNGTIQVIFLSVPEQVVMLLYSGDKKKEKDSLYHM